MTDQNENNTSIADIMGSFTRASAGGDEELLRIASNFSRQINGRQQRTLSMLKMFALQCHDKNPHIQLMVEHFLKYYMEIKQYHESGAFVMRALDAIAVKRYIAPDAVKVNVNKSSMI